MSEKKKATILCFHNRKGGVAKTNLCVNTAFIFSKDFKKKVLVIDTEMEEVPETEEDAVAAAQELVGNNVCIRFVWRCPFRCCIASIRIDTNLCSHYKFVER